MGYIDYTIHSKNELGFQESRVPFGECSKIWEEKTCDKAVL
jgi:hypothetical protein